MSIVVRSMVNYAQTLDSVSLGPWAVQVRPRVTAALTAALASKLIQIDQVESGPVTIQTEVPAAGNTVQADDNAECLVLNHAGTLATLTVNMPANPYDGQPLEVFFNAVVTTLTMSAGSKTLKGGLTAAAANGFGRWRYSKADTTWYRVG